MNRQEWSAARRLRVTLLAVVTGAVVAGATGLAASSSTASHRGNGLESAAAQTAQAAGRLSVAPSGQLRVLSVSPGNSAEPVTAADPVRVFFSAELSPKSPRPSLSPAQAGKWRTVGNVMVFTPKDPVKPTTELTLRIPAGSSGVRSATGAVLATPETTEFQAGGLSTLRLEQLLAQLGYLPVTWAQQSGVIAASYVRRDGDATAAAEGVFTFQSGYPAELTSQWQAGKPSSILTGALMAFQSDHGLPMSGTASKALWRALLKAAARDQQNPHGYTYALVSKTEPETLTIWHDGRVAVHGLANTGAAATPTPDGTFPVYLKEKAQVVTGLMPNGEHYADLVHFVSYFHGDYAVHSMVRASYGSPQSLGCVELPLSEARQAWTYLTYGSLVTITG
jgi:peptidoglycan hydrolase-like protein with peptidoglycan-binding domain